MAKPQPVRSENKIFFNSLYVDRSNCSFVPLFPGLVAFN